MLCFPISVSNFSRPAGRRTFGSPSQMMASKTLKLQNDLPLIFQFGGDFLSEFWFSKVFCK